MLRIFCLLLLQLMLIPVEASDDLHAAKQYYESGKNHFLLQQYKEAVSDFEYANTAFRSSSSDQSNNLLNTRASLAISYWNMGNGRKAEKLAEECLTELTKYKDKEIPELIDAYLYTAELYVILDYSFDITDFLLERSTRIINKFFLADNSKKAILCALKGYSDYLKGDNESAFNYLNRSNELLNGIPQLNRYKCMNQVYLALLKISLNDSFSEAIAFARKIEVRDDLTDEGRVFLDYAFMTGYNGLRDTLKAIKYCTRVIEAASVNPTGNNLTAMGRAYYDLSLYSKSRDQRLFYLNKALKTALRISDKGKEVAFLYFRIGRFYHEDKNPVTALKYTQKALIASSFDFHDTSYMSNPPVNNFMQFGSVVRILFLKGSALPLINTNDKTYTKYALQCFETAYELLDRRLHSLDMESSGLELIDMRQQLLSYVVTHANYIYRYTGEEEYARKAFFYSEKCKAQVLKKYTEKTAILKACGVPDSIISKSDRLGNEIAEIQNLIVLNENKGKDISRLTQKLTYLNDQRDLLNYEIYHKYPLYKETGQHLEIPSIEDIRSALDPGQALIEYEIVRRRLITFVITKDEFYQYDQLINGDFQLHIENIRRQLSINPLLNNNDSSFTSFVTSSCYLYNILIKPVYKKIKGKRLIIVPPGTLSTIPFEVLIREGYNSRPDYSKLKWLLDEFPIIYAFSASYILDKSDQKYGKGMAAFIPEYGNSDTLANLKGAFDEVRFLKRKFGFRAFIKKRANERVFREKSPDFRIIHLAAHTNMNDSRPDLSGFILNTHKDSIEDGRLYAFEIKQMKLNAQLAVLNGCNTGFGALKQGEGLVSLARSFFFTGIRTVAYTLWSVSDEAAQKIVTGFYTELFRKQPPDIALRQSKLNFIKAADPVKAHPYYWAGFIVTGKTQFIQKPTDITKPLAITLLVIALFALYLTIRKNQRRPDRISSDLSE
jgi:CHAT domain-containing protein